MGRVLKAVVATAVVMAAVPGTALASTPGAFTDTITVTGAATATVAGVVNPGNETTHYNVEYDLAGSGWCASGGSSGTPAHTTSLQTLGFTDANDHDVSVDLSGLTPGQEYCADLTATNGSGNADGGQVVFAAGLPTAMTFDVTATGASTATVDGIVNPAGQTTSYAVDYDLASSSWCTSGGSTGSPAHATAPLTLGSTAPVDQEVLVDVTGLTGGTAYCLDLVASNGSGTGDGGQVPLIAGLPGTFTSDVTITGATTATVSGVVDPVGQTTSYPAEYDLASSDWCTSGGTSGSPAHATTPAALGSTDATYHDVTVDLSGLTAGADYCVGLVAHNGSGGSNVDQFTFTAGLPGAQTNDAVATGPTTATVTGSVDPAGQTTTYAVAYAPASSDWCTSGFGGPAGTTAPQTLPFTDTTFHDVSVAVSGLTPGTEYCADLIASNGSGNADGGPVGFGTITASSPAVRADPAGAIAATSAKLAGAVNPNGLATTYHFEYGPSAAYGSLTPTVSAGSASSEQAVSAAVGGLTPNTAYHYRLVATNAAGTSASADRTFTTEAGATVAVKPPVTTPKLAGPPVISGAALGRRSFTAKRGTTLRFTLSEPARVTVLITTTVKGHRVGGVCKKAAPKGRSCRVVVKVATLTISSGGGRSAHALVLPGLHPGHYVATLIARDAAGRRSKAVTLSFTVLAAR